MDRLIPGKLWSSLSALGVQTKTPTEYIKTSIYRYDEMIIDFWYPAAPHVSSKIKTENSKWKQTESKMTTTRESKRSIDVC